MVSRNYRTEGLPSASNAISEARRDRAVAVNDNTETLPIANTPISTRRWKEKLFRSTFLTAFVAAMIGWLVGLGWAAISLLNWLFS